MSDSKLGIMPTDPLAIKQEQDSDLVATTGRILGAEDALRAIAQSTGYGSLKSAMTAMFLGHNHRGAGNPVPVNTEQYGMTFFTRPRLNLSYDNIKHIRKFTPLLTDDQDSIPRALRAYLDPDGSKLYYPSRLVDPLKAFIPLLDNNVITITGWPDPYVDTYTSKEGLGKEQWSMVDGYAEIHGVLSLQASFRNIPKDPITYLFHIWTRYAAYVHEGRIDPRPDSILENEVDYNTRPYRLTLDPTRQYVEHIAAPIAAFPKSDSTGAIFNYSDDKPISREVDQVSCEFQAMGMIYHDPILIQEFNDVVCMFNPNMFDGVREKVYTPLSAAYKPIFVNMGYPRINPYTSELEWWVANDTIKEVIRNIQQYPGMDTVSSISPVRR